MSKDGESKEEIELLKEMNKKNEENDVAEDEKRWEEMKKKNKEEDEKRWEGLNARYIKDLEEAKSWGERKTKFLEIKFSSTLNSLQKEFLNKFRKDALPAMESFFETLDSRQKNIYYEWQKVYCEDVDNCQHATPLQIIATFFNRIRQRVPMRVGIDVPGRDDVAYNAHLIEMAKFMQSVKKHQLRLQHLAETKIFLGDEEISYVELELTGMGIEDLKLLEEEGWKRQGEIESEEDRLNERIQERRKGELEKILGQNPELGAETLMDYFHRSPHVLSLPDWKKDLVYDSYDRGIKDNLTNEKEYHLPRNGLYPAEKRMITKFFGRQGKGNKHKVRRRKKSTRSKRIPKKSRKLPKKSRKLPKRRR